MVMKTVTRALDDLNRGLLVGSDHFEVSLEFVCGYSGAAQTGWVPGVFFIRVEALQNMLRKE